MYAAWRVYLFSVGALLAGTSAHPVSYNSEDDGEWSLVRDVFSVSSHRTVNELYPSAVLFGTSCGGTIISSTWILTAAHCTYVTNGRIRRVLAGTNSTRDGSGVRRRVKRLVIHPRFSAGPYWLDAQQFGIRQLAAHWDFLLVELEYPLPLDGKTMVAAPLDERARIPAGEEVGYAGYGAAVHGGTLREEMRAMDLQVLDDNDCSSLPQYNGVYMVCAKGRPPHFDSVCGGDSGSGLVSSGTLVGVVSWAENDMTTCDPNARAIFSRVSVARDWIKQVTDI